MGLVLLVTVRRTLTRLNSPEQWGELVSKRRLSPDDTVLVERDDLPLREYRAEEVPELVPLFQEAGLLVQSESDSSETKSGQQHPIEDAGSPDVSKDEATSSEIKVALLEPFPPRQSPEGLTATPGEIVQPLPARVQGARHRQLALGVTAIGVLVLLLFLMSLKIGPVETYYALQTAEILGSPDQAAKPLAVLQRGHAVEGRVVREADRSWLQLTSEGQPDGFVALERLGQAPPPTLTERYYDTAAYQAPGAIEVYRRPSLTSEPVLRLRGGEPLQRVGRLADGWTEVVVAGADLGYVRPGGLTLKGPPSDRARVPIIAPASAETPSVEPRSKPPEQTAAGDARLAKLGGHPALGPAIPAPAPLAPLNRPRWDRLPTQADLQHALNRFARDPGQGGSATLECFADRNGALVRCTVAAETPPGNGFGEAALALAPAFRLRSTDDEGHSVEGRTLKIPLQFQVTAAAN